MNQIIEDLYFQMNVYQSPIYLPGRFDQLACSLHATASFFSLDNLAY